MLESWKGPSSRDVLGQGGGKGSAQKEQSKAAWAKSQSID